MMVLVRGIHHVLGGRMAKLEDFTVAAARPMPVIVLADTSGSMSVDGKIESLNLALQTMKDSLAAEDQGHAQIQIAVIAFGGESPQIAWPLAPAISTEWTPLTAAGKTPMGAAFEMARELIEDRDRIPSRAYRPSLVLVSDGKPTDEWEPSLAALDASDRASKAARFALAIGADAYHPVLERFINDSAQRVIEAHEAGTIVDFFNWVTMSVTLRSRSVDPNDTSPASFAPTDDFPF
jgi:uncharacterized protein YegL